MKKADFIWFIISAICLITVYIYVIFGYSTVTDFSFYPLQVTNFCSSFVIGTYLFKKN